MRPSWICAVLVLASPAWATRPAAQFPPSQEETAQSARLKAGAEADLQAGHYEAAIPKLQRALKLTPNDAVLHKYLGACLINSGRPDEAVVEYRAYVRLAPDDPEAARVRQMLSAYEHARGDAPEPAPQAVKAPPARERPAKEAPAEHPEAERLIQAGKYEEAAAQLRQAIAANPNDAMAHKYLGGCLVNLGQADEAVGEYRKFVQLAPQHPEAARVRQMIQAYEKARDNSR